MTILPYLSFQCFTLLLLRGSYSKPKTHAYITIVSHKVCRLAQAVYKGCVLCVCYYRKEIPKKSPLCITTASPYSYFLNQG